MLWHLPIVESGLEVSLVEHVHCGTCLVSMQDLRTGKFVDSVEMCRHRLSDLDLECEVQGFNREFLK